MHTGFGEEARGKRPLGRPGLNREDSIKTDLREMGWGAVDYINLAQNRGQWRVTVNIVMNLL
jgi:hypothetical protein